MLASSLCGHKSSTAPGRQHNIQPWSPNSHTWVRVLATINVKPGSTPVFLLVTCRIENTHVSQENISSMMMTNVGKESFVATKTSPTKSWQILMRLPSVATVHTFSPTLMLEHLRVRHPLSCYIPLCAPCSIVEMEFPLQSPTRSCK